MQSQGPHNIIVRNIDPAVTVESLASFFSFSGNVVEIRVADAADGTKLAIIQFDSEESVKTAEFMTGATLENRRVTVEATTMVQATEHDRVFRGDNLPKRALPDVPQDHTKTSVVASLLASGYVLAADAFQKAVQFDKTHGITTAVKEGAEKVKQAAINVDESLHLTEYLALGATMAVSYVEGVNEKYKITETIADKAHQIDNTLGVSEALQTAQQTLNRGIATVVNSEPVVNARTKLDNSISNLASQVNQEVQSKRATAQAKNEQEMQTEEGSQEAHMGEQTTPNAPESYQNETISLSPEPETNEVQPEIL